MRAFRAPFRTPARQRGIALILVIWLSMLLMMIAGAFAYAMRTDAKAARNAAHIAQGEALAQAAVARTVMELYKGQGSPEVWKRDGEVRNWAFDGVEVTIRLSDESAKIDINTANNELLKGLFRSAGLSEEDAAKLLDAVLDWRDPDTLKRPNGAEEAEYEQAGLKYRPANYPFQSIEEIQLVLGFKPELYQRIAPMITVYSRQPGVNPHIATRAVLSLIPGVTPEQVDLYLAERDLARKEGRPNPIFTAAGAYATYAQTAAVTVRADVALEGGVAVSREAVAMLTPQYQKRPFTFLAWREISRLMDSKSPAPDAGATPKEAADGKLR